MNKRALNKKNREYVELKCFELAERHYTYREISDTMDISLGKVGSILGKVRAEAKEDIKTWLDDRLPYEYVKSLALIQRLSRKAEDIANNSKDERVVLASMSLVRELDQSKRDLLSSSAVINQTVAYLESTKLKILQSQIDLKSEVAIVTSRLDDEAKAAEATEAGASDSEKKAKPEQEKEGIF